MVDRARVVTRRRVSGAPRVAGRTPLEGPTEVPWFRCRLNLAQPDAEQRGDRPSAARSKTPRTPSLLYSTTAEDGTAVELGPADELEVEANHHGDGEARRWQVSGAPLILRRKRRLLGAGLIGISRVEEAEG
jgi:hypothetical protein